MERKGFGKIIKQVKKKEGKIRKTVTESCGWGKGAQGKV